MTYTKKQLPKYCHHKSTDRAYVRFKGKPFISASTAMPHTPVLEELPVAIHVPMMNR